MNPPRLEMITLVVPDYDEAIEFFVGKLGFSLRIDQVESSIKRWVEIEGNAGMRLLLAKAANKDQECAIGNQTGGRVGFFLYTDDFDSSYRSMIDKGVVFRETPRLETYGKVAVFEDVVGNLWDLIEPARNFE